MGPAQLKKLDAASYHVAWICAVADLELIPALLMLDEYHERPDIDNQYDDNTYKFGTMAGHNVVVATCPDAMTGQVNVSYIAGPLFRTFTAIRMTLLVGIGGGVPQKNLFSEPLKDVRLGDVVVGWPSHADGKPAVVYHDSGRSMVSGFQTTTQLNRPHMVLLKALPFVRTDHTLGKSNFHIYLERLQHHEELGDQFRHPGLEHDLLFKSTYEHVGDYYSYCAECDNTNLVQRKPRAESQKDKFIFHQGRIATGNSVIQDGRKRDLINEQHGNVFCIEMEAAGVDINSSCLVIRGISDYADSHKSDKWRSYAAGKAVVFARELLGKIPPKDVKEKMASGNKHWLVDRSTNPHFTGRREEIDRLVKTLTSEDTQSEQQRFVLTGMGGQGKSEICLHVANEVRDRFWGIFWVDVSTQNTAEESFSEVAEALGCSKSIDAVRKTLANLPPSSRWLLILDNADDLHTDYQTYMPSGNRGAILVTSRNPQCGHFATAGGHEALDGLEEPECIRLLQKAARIRDIENGTEEYAFAVSLVRHLGHHTLAILHAGSYIATAHCTTAEYLEILGTNRRRLFERSRGQGQSRYDTVYATFGASIEFLERPEAGTSDEARKDSLELLKVLSTFHYMNIPLAILVDAWEGVEDALSTPKEWEMVSGRLTAWHVAQVPEFIRNEKDDVRFRITEAVTRLESLALVRTEQSGRAWKLVSMHPLVHGWAGDRQSQQERRKVLRMTQCIVALTEYAFSSWRPYYHQFTLHLKRLVELDVDLMEDAVQSRCVLQACVQIAWLYHRSNLDRDTYEFTGRIFQQLGLHDQEPTVELRQFYHVFAVAAEWEGAPVAQAVQVFEAIAGLDETILDENDPVRLRILRALGNAYRQNQQTKEAVPLLRKVVKAFQDLGEEDSDLLSAQHDLALALTDDGQTEEAIALLENVVRIKKKLLPADHPNLVASQHVLATSYLKDGQIEEATLRLEEVARVHAQTLGEEHPTTAITQHWLADAHKQSGRLPEAIALYERVVNTRTLVLGENHPILLKAQHVLACAYSDASKTQEAINILERVVDIRKFTLKEKDPERLASEHELGLAYFHDGRAAEAINILERVVDIRKSILKEKDPKQLSSQRILGLAYLEDGRVAEAIKILERVVDIQESIFKEEDPKRIGPQYALGRAYREEGRVAEAIKILERVVDIQKSTFKEKDPRRIAPQYTLGRAYLEEGRVAEAIDILEQVVDIKKLILEEKDPERLASQHVLGLAYLKGRRVAEAIGTLEHVVEVEGSLYEQGHPTRVVSQELLDKARLMRDSLLPTSSTSSSSEDIGPGVFLRSVEASNPGRIDDGMSAEEEGQGADLSGQHLEGAFSNTLVLRERPGRAGGLRARLSSMLSRASSPRLAKGRGLRASRDR